MSHPTSRTTCQLALPLLLLSIFAGCPAKVDPSASNSHKPSPSADVPVAPATTPVADSSVPLFDGESLAGWKVTSFGGEGEVQVQDGCIVIEPGFPLTGLTSTRTDLPTTNYEISLQARKTNGIDFFCGLTFPVGDSHCSLIVGGWAGSVVGLSMIDDQDANNNETRRLKKFERGTWYNVRLRVTPELITAWIDDEKMIEQTVVGKKFAVRNETLPCRPLGICSFETRAEIRNFVLTKLPQAK